MSKPVSELLLFPRRAQPSDAAERADALDIHQSWIVEAPAGSGKTGLLIQRYLKLLADGSVTAPEQVLAITFTTKATAEMRERVLAQLQAAADRTQTTSEFESASRQLAESVLARDRALGWSVLDQPGRLRIKTIDAVCSEIANSLPLLSGSGGRNSPIDDPDQLYALAARRTFLELGGPDRELHEALSTILLHRDGNLAECERRLSQMLALRDQWDGFVPVGRVRLDDAWLEENVLTSLNHALDKTICAALSQLVDAIPAGFLAQLALAAQEMAHGDSSPALAICANRSSAPGATADDLDHWRALIHLLATTKLTWRKRVSRKTSAGATIANIVENLKENDELLELFKKLDSLPPARYPAEQWVVAKSLFRVLNRALAELQLVFAERGECDFTEVALGARTALTSSDGPHDLEAALGVRLQHILVDEMQDTSYSQYELIQALTRSWDGHSQTVFLVGDPKQSIYLFRQARVERFLRTMRDGELGELPLGVLRLTANFRSRATLVDEFNADFESIFPAAWDPLHPEEVPYVRAIPARPRSENAPVPETLGAPFVAEFRDEWDGAGDTADQGLALAAGASVTPRVWHAPVLPYETDRARKSRDIRARRLSDAVEVVRIVDDWRSRPLRANRANPWTIAVLCRSRNHLDEIVAAFKSASIPFRAVDIDPLKDCSEVQDLIALTRALLHPADRVAWLAILRAPWCGLSLAELHTLTGADDHAWAERAMQQVVVERGHLLPDDACQRLQRIWPVLEAAIASRARLSVAQLVERTWRSLGGDSYLDATERTNAARCLQLLDEIEEAPGGFDLSLLERRLDKLYAAPTLEEDAVDLLTIHKAKGLEWDVVIVPALERRAPADRGRLLDWIELDSADGHSAHGVLAPIAGKGEESQELNKWIRGICSTREAAERKRLFYVACTRAKEELHLFAAPSRSANGQVKPVHNSLLNAAWPAAEPYVTAIETIQPPAIDASADESDSLNGSQVPGAASLRGLIANGQENAALRRLPLAFNPATQFRNEYPLSCGNQTDSAAAPRFKRPEGSLAARAFGNAVHAFLEQIALQMAADEPPAKLLAELPTWNPRIAAVLRSEGLPPAVVERLAERVLFALETTLKDPTGLWLLSPHIGAATEYALTAWFAHRSSIRIDRIFRAGPEPRGAGKEHLWIVDYKTSSNGTEGVAAFLAAEKLKYAPQLDAYGSVLSQTEGKAAIRLALYYPLLAQLIWWPWQ